MLLASEVTRTFTAAEFFLALFQALAFVGTMIWVKVVLYRRRVREDEAHRLQWQRERDQAQWRLHSHHPGMTPSNQPSRFTTNRTLRNPERKLRSRLNRAAATTNGLLLGARRMPLQSSTATTQPAPKRLSYQSTAAPTSPLNQEAKLL